ncbi:hypothetical protein KSS87_022481 [Heliosperma pusillum]|nr:hypothetical protein KSS87_022481 [Heliosperma pusillum]
MSQCYPHMTHTSDIHSITHSHPFYFFFCFHFTLFLPISNFILLLNLCFCYFIWRSENYA